MRHAVMIAVCCVLVSGGCDLVDPARPTVQPDTEVFGNLLEVSQSEEDPIYWTAQVRVGPPRALRAADEESGKPTPSVEKGLVATVTVGPDSVVVADDGPAELEAIPSGTEIVIVPIPGTTRMLGHSDLRLDAETLIDFSTYTRWKLPKLAEFTETTPDDPARVNSTGSELAPVPVADGRVLYFSAHLRPPALPEGGWHGALRDGLEPPGEGGGLTLRSYRTALGEDGWSAPELVVFPGLDDAVRQKVSWVADDETSCVVTVESASEPPWVGVATRANVKAPWGEVAPVEGIGPQARDAVYLRGSTTKFVFGSDRGGRDRDDLFLYDPEMETGPMPLQPQICTFGREWNPRTGPQGELFFCREDRQMFLQGGEVHNLRVPGSHRTRFTQAAPTSDGKWVFLCMPKYRPIVFDEDIYVAPVVGGGWVLGSPVRVDDWRP